MQPKRIIHTVLNNIESNFLTTDDLTSLKRSIYGERRKNFPKLPKSLSELQSALQELGEELKTNRSEDFLLINDIETNIVVFTCNTNLEHLCKCTL